LSENIVRCMLLLRILNLFKVESCPSKNLIDRAVLCFNEGILPCIPEYGSVGASGDLAPLAHLACIFTTDGKGHRFGEHTKIQPLKNLLPGSVELGPKDGLAFINGVQGILAVSLSNLYFAQDLLSLGNLIHCASLDAYLGTTSHCDPKLFISRPHRGMKKT